MATYGLHLATVFALIMTMILSTDISMNGLGVFNIAQGTTASAGGYAVGVVSAVVGWPIGFGVLAGAVLGAAMGTIVAVISQRARGDLLAIATLCLALLITSIFRNGGWITGGARGLNGIASLASIPSESALTDMVAAMAVLSIGGVAWASVRRGPLHRIVLAVRDQPITCQSVGINPRALNALVLALAGAIAGLAGALYAAHLGVVSPDTFSLGETFGLLGAAILVARSGVVGAILGSALIVLVPEALALVAPTSEIAFAVRESLSALLLPAILAFDAHIRSPAFLFQGNGNE
jgi:ABC-type branched-subunit amino acid transport system permease subunit